MHELVVFYLEGQLQVLFFQLLEVEVPPVFPKSHFLYILPELVELLLLVKELLVKETSQHELLHIDPMIVPRLLINGHILAHNLLALHQLLHSLRILPPHLPLSLLQLSFSSP